MHGNLQCASMNDGSALGDALQHVPPSFSSSLPLAKRLLLPRPLVLSLPLPSLDAAIETGANYGCVKRRVAAVAPLLLLFASPRPSLVSNRRSLPFRCRTRRALFRLLVLIELLRPFLHSWRPSFRPSSRQLTPPFCRLALRSLPLLALRPLPLPRLPSLRIPHAASCARWNAAWSSPLTSSLPFYPGYIWRLWHIVIDRSLTPRR